jgi:hypothetical protein
VARQVQVSRMAKHGKGIALAFLQNLNGQTTKAFLMSIDPRDWVEHPARTV